MQSNGFYIANNNKINNKENNNVALQIFLSYPIILFINPIIICIIASEYISK